VGARTRISGFYRDDAARIAADAARIASPTPDAPPTAPVVRATPPISIDEPTRAPLAPRQPTNQNVPVDMRPAASARPPRRLRRIIAWVVIAPWYVAIIALSGCILVLAAKFLLGL
jgi:hypothetical protein